MRQCLVCYHLEASPRSILQVSHLLCSGLVKRNWDYGQPAVALSQCPAHFFPSINCRNLVSSAPTLCGNFPPLLSFFPAQQTSSTGIPTRGSLEAVERQAVLVSRPAKDRYTAHAPTRSAHIDSRRKSGDPHVHTAVVRPNCFVDLDRQASSTWMPALGSASPSGLFPHGGADSLMTVQQFGKTLRRSCGGGAGPCPRASCVMAGGGRITVVKQHTPRRL